MKTFTTFLSIITLFITQFSSAQTCDVPDNIYQNVSDRVIFSTTYDYGQSFTALCNGHIQSISVFTTEVTAPVSGTLNIYEGTPAPPFTGVNTIAPVYQQAVNWGTSSSETQQTIELTPSFAVVSGIKYTFIITGTVGKVTYQISDFIQYDGGFFMYRNPSTSYWQRDGGRDQKFQIHYTDVIAPDAQCKNATIYLDANGQATLSPLDIDNNTPGGVVSRSVSKSSFDCTNLGANTVTLTVNDASLNSSNCDATVTVIDNLSPINTSCPQDIVVNSCGLEPITYDIPTFTDNCEVVSINRIAGPESGSVFPINQTTTVTHRATDSSGNFTDCTFTVTLPVDNLPPVNTTCPQNIVVNNCGLAAVTYDIPTFTDNCEVVSVERIAGPESGSVFPINQTTTVTHRATDSSGLTTDCTFTVTPQDLVFPTVTGIPEDQIINLSGDQCEGFIPAYEPIISDNCPGVVTDLVTGVAGTGPFLIGTTVNTFTFTDLGGNVTTESFSVTVNDNLSPLTCVQVDDIYVDTAETTIEVDFPKPTFTGCGTLTQTIGNPPGTALSEGDHPIEYTLYDHNGDVSETCSFTIHVASSLNYFITTWQVDGGQSLTIPTSAGETYNYEVDWNYIAVNGFNSGGTYTGNATSPLNQYTETGVYQIAIKGLFPRIYFSNSAVNKDNIIEINQWGNNPWTSMEFAFTGCTNLDLKALDTPDLSNADSLYLMFALCGNLEGSEANWDWDVSTINDMLGVFTTASNFNGNISSWNTSNVTEMASMFNGASSFNQPIDNWNTSKVENMQLLFKDATSFNRNIGNWDLSSIQVSFSMQDMFENVTLDTAVYDAILIGWSTDTSPLLNDDVDDIPTGIEFHGGNSQYCLAENAWNKLDTDHTWNIIDGGLETNGCNNNAEDYFITTWNVDASDLNIIIPTTGSGYAYQVDWNYDESNGFDNASDPVIHTGNADYDYGSAGTKTIAIRGNFPRIYFNEGYIGNQIIGDHKKILTVEQWGTGVWASMNNAFSGCNNLNIIADDVPNLSNVTDMTNMFAFCENLTGNAKFNEWDVSSVQNMSKMFEGALIFNQDINAWNVGNVTSMHSMFSFAEIFNKPLSGWDVSNVSNMGSMFFSAYQFNQPIGNWDVSSLITAQSMFQESAFNQNIGNWDISKVTNMQEIFNSTYLSNNNYDNILIGWGTDSSPLDDIDNIPSNINLYIVQNSYCSSIYERQNLTDNFGWNIPDYGLRNNCFGANDYFITTWNLDDVLDLNIIIPTTGSGYSYKVDWNYVESNGFNHGSDPTIHTGNASHDYGSVGTKTIAIRGLFPRIYFNNIGDKDKVQSVEQWGTGVWTSMNNAFNGCNNLKILANDVPNLSNVTDLTSMFSLCANLTGNAKFNEWDVSNIETMNSMFKATNFNAELTAWEVDNVEDMAGMFQDNSAFNNAGFNTFGSWDVDNVKYMNSMFEGATSFTQDIVNWNVSSVQNMTSMFSGATSFNGHIGTWIVSNVEFMGSMFQGAIGFDQNIVNWNVSSVQNMTSMFSGATSFNGNIGSWNVSSVQTMNEIFFGASVFNQDLSGWDISLVSNMENMFSQSNLSIANYDATLIGWATDSSPLTDDGIDDIPNNVDLDATSAFCESIIQRQSLIDTYGWTIEDDGISTTCYDASDYFITTWETTGVNETITIPTTGNGYAYEVDWSYDDTSFIASNEVYSGNATSPQYATPGEHKIAIRGLFPRIYFFSDVDVDKILTVEQWGTIKWNSMYGAFTGCTNLEVTAQDTPDLSNTNDLTYMFSNCENLDGSAANWVWDVSTIDNMYWLFYNTPNFIGNTGITSWNVSNVDNMSHMFASATNFNQPIGSWNTSKVEDMSNMFSNTSSFDKDISAWNVSSVENMNEMFFDASSFDRDISGWNVSMVTKMSLMFYKATAFNRDISSWDVGNVANMKRMFYDATSFDQNLGAWDIGKLERYDVYGDGSFWDRSMIDMFVNTGMSVANYDNTLIGWATDSSPLTDDGIDDIPSNVILNATLTYCLSVPQRQNLIDNYGWSITDGGLDSGCITNYFVTTWNTTAGETITIPTTGTGYTFVVEWGDGAITAHTDDTGVVTHQYATTDTSREIKISGDFPRIYFNGDVNGDKDKILTIEEWGDNAWTSMENAFMGCSNLDVTATDVPNLSNATSMFTMFGGCTNLVGDQANWDWDVSSIENMAKLFFNAENFNQSINSWDVINVENMTFMFAGAVNFNERLDAWDVDNVTNMDSMFAGAVNFNRQIASWNVDNVMLMGSMFAGAVNFDEYIDSWVVSSVIDMGSMFSGATSFNQDLNSWNVSNVQTMYNMFDGATNFNGDISGWDVSSVTQMFSMFADASAFDQDLGNWDLSSVSSMEDMFENVTLSTSNYDATLMGWATDTSPSPTDEDDDIPIGINFHGGNSQYCAIEAWNLLTATSGNGGYNWTIVDGDLDPTCGETYFITTWNLSDLSDLSITIPTFSGETYNYEVDWNYDPANGFNSGGTYTSDATSPSNQYAATGEYKVAIRGDFPRIYFASNSGDNNKIIDINQWGTNPWTNMFGAFTACENIDVTAQDTPDLSNADNMNFMFAYSTNLEGSTANWDWDVSTITNMNRVFESTSFVGNASISFWNTRNVTQMVHMFKKTSFNQNIGNWDLSSMLQFQMDGMFEDVTLSTAVYDAILFGWATDSTVPGDGIDDIPVNTGFHGGNSRYCAAEDAWNTLNTDNSWNIIDGGGCSDSDLFITTWSVEENGTITIPTTGTGYDYVIDWNYNGTSFNGDGITYTDGDTATSPSYSAGGTYEIAVFGNFPRIYFNNQGDNDKITEIKQWGTGAWSSMENAFKGCYNLQLTATDSPDLSLVSSTNSMFYGCQTLTGHDSMNDWEMSTIFSMREMFTIATNFNANISSWDVSNVSDMFGLFLVASTFDQDISGWNVGNVTNMDNMFSSAGSFNKNIGGWDVTKVETMENMFYSATVFNQEIGGWNVGLVDNMRSMFFNASDFDGDISNWNVENVLVMDTMFRNATSFNQDLGAWDVSSVTNMYEMFAGATAFDQNIGAWDISSLNTANGTLGANGMFSGVELSVDNYDALLIGWATDTSPGDSVDDIPTGVTFSGGNSFYCEGAAARALLIADYGWTIATDDTYLPAYCGPEEDKFKTTWVLDSSDKSVRIPTTGTGYNYIVNWGDGITSINHNGDASHTYENAGTYQISISGDFPRIYFEDALSNNDKKIISIDQWGAQVWSSMEKAFIYCTNLEMDATDVPNLSQVESMDSMFQECSSALFDPSIGSWDVSNVTSMRRLFTDAYLFDQDINAWNVGNVTNMSYMFNNAQLYNQPLNNWDVSSVTNMEGMFFNAEIFDQDLGDWDISMLSNALQMFEEIGLSIENYDALLIGWSTLDTSEGETQIPTGVQFNGGNSIYCDGAAARGILSDPPYNWGISDGGECGFFKTTWRTTEANESITIYTSSTDLPSLPDELEEAFVYDYNIDWGDGQVDLNVTGNISHTYLTAGDYPVKIEGVFPHIAAGNVYGDLDNAAKLISIDTWGDLEWKSMAFSFAYCTNMELNASDIPDVSQVTDMIAAFAICYIITDPDLSGWDVSNVEIMTHTFREANLFTGDITQWDVSSVTDMAWMFSDALQFNGDLNGWVVSNVITMEGMFSDANTFNRDLNDWDVTSVKNMDFLFNGETHFNGNISSWDVSGVTSMLGMFSANEGFNQNIGSWDVRSVNNISYMFDEATTFDQNLATWDLSNVLTAENMFFDSGMSLANYDDTLIGWATDTSPLIDDGIDDIPSNVILDATVGYCLSASARLNLINNYGWDIDDGGLDPNCDLIEFSPKIFLQGASLNPNVGETDWMRDDLRVAGLLPTTSPYIDNVTTVASVFDITGEDAIVDWVFVELRDKDDSNLIIDSKSALLQRDGDIVATDGVSNLFFNVTSREYYISINHRNHLGVLSTNAIPLSSTPTSIDFSSDVTTVTGGALALKDMGNGIYAMYAGDVTSDGNVLNIDISTALSTSGVINVYTGADANMDGNILNTDIALIIQPNAGRIQQF